MRLPLIGKFNIYNSLAALAAATCMGVQLRAAILALATAPSVPGRLQLVPAKRNYQVYVDYAHTDDALQNVLRTLRELDPHRFIVVFGCGGDRDRRQAPAHGSGSRAVERPRDHYLRQPAQRRPGGDHQATSSAASKAKYEVIVDRREAIVRAISLARARDIVLIAGKGHENYQEFAHETVPFDDVLIAQAAIDNRPVELD